MKKKSHRAPGCRFANLYGRRGTEKPRLEKTLPPPKPGHNVLPNAGQHPKIHTSSFAVSHTHLAALPWGPRPANGRRRRELHRRRSGLDSHLRWRSGKGPQLERSLNDTQHREGFAEFPAITWGFGASFVSINPLEANWVASFSRPCLRFGGVLVHLHVAQILCFLLTGSFDFTWIQWSPLDVVLCFPLLRRFFINR